MNMTKMTLKHDCVVKTTLLHIFCKIRVAVTSSELPKCLGRRRTFLVNTCQFCKVDHSALYIGFGVSDSVQAAYTKKARMMCTARIATIAA